MLRVEDESIPQVDEALANLVTDLKTDEYGNRMTWQRKQNILANIDRLLDSRNALSQ